MICSDVPSFILVISCVFTLFWPTWIEIYQLYWSFTKSVLIPFISVCFLYHWVPLLSLISILYLQLLCSSFSSFWNWKVRLLTWSLFYFLKKALNFSLSTTLAKSHTFCFNFHSVQNILTHYLKVCFLIFIYLKFVQTSLLLILV